MNLSQFSRRTLLTSAVGLGAAALSRPSRGAAALPMIRIGILTDLSGAYRDVSGPMTVLAARQAVEDFQPVQYGFDATVISGDHGNKADLATAIARQWYDQDKVDVIGDVNNTSVALAVSSITALKDKTLLITGGASEDLSGKSCTGNQVQFALDTYGASHTTGSAVLDAGGDTWFLITPDYAFGRTIADELTALVEKRGGKVLGNAIHPFPGTTDFSSYLLRAQASGAKVVGFCNSGTDLETCIKQAHEFGLPENNVKLVSLFGLIQQIKSMGLETGQGLQIAETFYWDLNDRTRAFTKRLLTKSSNNYPNSLHSSCYAAVTHYLKAVASLKPETARSGRTVVAEMKRLPTDDDCFGKASIQENGRFLGPVTLFTVKAPSASKNPWDLYSPVKTVRGREAFRPIEDSGCRLPQVAKEN